MNADNKFVENHHQSSHPRLHATYLPKSSLNICRTTSSPDPKFSCTVTSKDHQTSNLQKFKNNPEFQNFYKNTVLSQPNLQASPAKNLGQIDSELSQSLSSLGDQDDQASLTSFKIAPENQTSDSGLGLSEGKFPIDVDTIDQKFNKNKKFFGKMDLHQKSQNSIRSKKAKEKRGLSQGAFPGLKGGSSSPKKSKKVTTAVGETNLSFTNDKDNRKLFSKDENLNHLEKEIEISQHHNIHPKIYYSEGCCEDLCEIYKSYDQNYDGKNNFVCYCCPIKCRSKFAVCCDVVLQKLETPLAIIFGAINLVVLIGSILFTLVGIIILIERFILSLGKNEYEMKQHYLLYNIKFGGHTAGNDPHKDDTMISKWPVFNILAHDRLLLGRCGSLREFVLIDV